MEEAWKKSKAGQQKWTLQFRGLKCHTVELYEFALMSDLVTRYQLLNFVNLWVSYQNNNNKEDSTSQECSFFIDLLTLAVS